MGNQQRSFKESTNFAFSVSILSVLKEDCERFGYIKNNKANISGFLNSLIPSLSHYREELHSKFISYNHNDKKIAQLVERNIYNIYLKTFDLNDDAALNVAFRIKKNCKNEFMYIHDVLLETYDMDFTSYIRTLLNEYCSKRAADRELFYYYDKIQIIKDCIVDKRECKFYTKDNKVLSFVPIVIDIYCDTNYICGITIKGYNYASFQLSKLDNIVELDNTIVDKSLNYDTLYESFLSLIREENK